MQLRRGLLNLKLANDVVIYFQKDHWLRQMGIWNDDNRILPNVYKWIQNICSKTPNTIQWKCVWSVYCPDWVHGLSGLTAGIMDLTNNPLKQWTVIHENKTSMFVQCIKTDSLCFTPVCTCRLCGRLYFLCWKDVWGCRSRGNLPVTPNDKHIVVGDTFIDRSVCLLRPFTNFAKLK